MSILVGPTTLSATGGVISKLTGFTVHTFSTPGPATFIPTGSGIIEVLVVGGGGHTSVNADTGGGGGGAVIYNKFVNVTSGTPYPITVGSVGAQNVVAGTSACFGITAAGGGGGGAISSPGISSPFASGGGPGSSVPSLTGGVGAGITGLGFPGGLGTNAGGGGGGGAGGAGSLGGNSGSPGGIGVSYSITGISSYYGGGSAGRGGATAGNPNGGVAGASFGLGGTPGAVIIRYPS